MQDPRNADAPRENGRRGEAVEATAHSVPDALADATDEWEPREARRRQRAARELLRDIWARLSRHVPCDVPEWVDPSGRGREGLTPAAAAYLESRGIHPHGLDLCAVERTNWQRMPYPEIVLADAGLLTSAGRLHLSWWAEWILFPYRGRDGQIQTMRARTIHPVPEGGAKMLSLCGAMARPDLPYGAPAQIEIAADMAAPLYVVEGELDAHSIWQCGRRAIAIPGCRGWRDEWCAGWLALAAVVVLTDGDEAGLGMARTILRACIDRYGRDWTADHIHIHTFASGTDANDWLQRGELDRELDRIEAAIGEDRP